MENSLKLDYYANHEYVSNSMLGWLKRSPLYFKACVTGNFEKKETTSLERGTLLHKYILEPDKFIVEDIEPVSGLMGRFIKYKAEGCDDATAWFYSGFKIPVETVVKNFEKSENKAYYDFLKLANGKLAISKQDKHVIENCVQSLINNKTAFNLLFGENPDMEIHNEYEIYEDDFIVPGFKAKAKLDRVLVNRKDDYAIVMDLKTTSKSCYGSLNRIHYTGIPAVDYHTTGFYTSYIGYDYYRQQSYYASLAMKHFGVKTVESFIIPVETGGMFESTVYKQSKDFALMGLEEVKRLVTQFMYHTKTDNWIVPPGFENGFRMI